MALHNFCHSVNINLLQEDEDIYQQIILEQQEN